ncbi:nucleotidyltransferase domain-containing protein [Desulfosporosinus sp.]|uniref:nucleotidyltransferase domain-containing protein n=1 Tax=Desulfosporosinus sp. TaxID=157907 RepID=UPI00345BD554
MGQNYAVDQIILFGTRARGDHKPTSDIDLAVFLSESNCKGHLISEFDDLNTLLKIDTIFVNETLNLNY